MKKLNIDFSGIDFSGLEPQPTASASVAARPRRFARVAVAALVLCVALLQRQTLLQQAKLLGEKASPVLEHAAQVVSEAVPPLREKVGSMAQAVLGDSDRPRVHVVRSGESLSKIARRYDIPYKALIAANQERYPSLATDPGLIHVGWELTVPPKDDAKALAASVVLPTPTPGPAGTEEAPAGGQEQQQPVAPTKVLYIVGQIDGLDGPETQQELSAARSEAQQLRRMGLDVALFEPGTHHWSDVLAQAPGAKALVYRGHGVYVGDLHHPETVGGFNLAPGEFVAKQQIANDLRVMSPGWVAILSGACFSAGHSGPEWDTDIGLEEAKRRVAIFSEDFLAAGAACYFAGQPVPRTIDMLLNDGLTCGDAYLSFPILVPARNRLAGQFEHPSYPGRALWLATSLGNYTDAFVGDPDARPFGS